MNSKNSQWLSALYNSFFNRKTNQEFSANQVNQHWVLLLRLTDKLMSSKLCTLTSERGSILVSEWCLGGHKVPSKEFYACAVWVCVVSICSFWSQYHIWFIVSNLDIKILTLRARWEVGESSLWIEQYIEPKLPSNSVFRILPVILLKSRILDRWNL